MEAKTFLKDDLAKNQEKLAGVREWNPKRYDSVESFVVEDILSDAEAFGFDDDGDYVNSWGVTNNYNADEPISLNLREDFEKM